jgi:hypothetical protein
MKEAGEEQFPLQISLYIYSEVDVSNMTGTPIILTDALRGFSQFLRLG